MGGHELPDLVRQAAPTVLTRSHSAHSLALIAFTRTAVPYSLPSLTHCCLVQSHTALDFTRCSLPSALLWPSAPAAHRGHQHTVSFTVQQSVKWAVLWGEWCVQVDGQLFGDLVFVRVQSLQSAPIKGLVLSVASSAQLFGSSGTPVQLQPGQQTAIYSSLKQRNAVSAADCPLPVTLQIEVEGQVVAQQQYKLLCRQLHG